MANGVQTSGEDTRNKPENSQLLRFERDPDGNPDVGAAVISPPTQATMFASSLTDTTPKSPDSAGIANISLQERERSLELAKYFSAASIVPNAIHQPPPDTPRPPPDHTLIALAQLGNFRLGTARAFISLIDRSHQYIIGEATRSTSILQPNLQNALVEQPNDGLYLGFQALELAFGVCPQTIHLFTTDDLRIENANIFADKTRYVIRDFCADSRFADRPYVKGFPHMRSYAEVPLTSDNGYVIGSYCVVDDKPRDFGDGEIIILNEIATCIMTHLALVKTKLDFQRVEGLVRGIGSYVAGYSGLQEQQTKTLPNRALDTPSHSDEVAPTPSRPSLIKATSSSGISTTSITSSARQSSERESANESFTRGSDPALAGADLEPTGERESSEAFLSQDIRTTFLRASHLVQQSMGMQQISFLDARRLNAVKLTKKSKSARKSSRTSTIDSEATSPRCVLLDQPPEAQDAQGSLLSTIAFDISEALLRRLLARYPFGHIFSYDDLGVITQPGLRSPHQDRMHPSRPDFSGTLPSDTDMEDADSAKLFDAVQYARSIIFLPLWDFQKGRWFAAAIGWTTDPSRVLDHADLNYLAAFCNSIMADVSRIETSALSRAKSDFISSISHELRSPLHGILAGTELLRKPERSRTDDAMLDTIDSCGHMLLDTIDHLLDFAKINSLAGRDRQSSVSSADEASDGNSTRLAFTDLGELVQDVVEGVQLGYARSSVKSDADHDAVGISTTLSNHQADCQSSLDSTVVCVDVEPSIDWCLESEVGAWKRIVMNLFGNALKYTSRGRIDVVLRLADQLDDSPNGRTICLEINDTGHGMSPYYLQHRLYTPFAQENHLSVGTGLGLSIVHQLVNNMGGSVDVQSELEKGSKITVLIPLGDKVRLVSAERQAKEPSLTRSAALDPAMRLKGLTLYLPRPTPMPPETPVASSETIDATGEATDVQTLFASIAERFFGMVISFESPPAIASGQQHFMIQQPRNTPKPDWKLRLFSPASAGANSGQSETEAVPDAVHDVEVSISQPFGPRKLALAFTQAMAEKSSAPLSGQTGNKAYPWRNNPNDLPAVPPSTETWSSGTSPSANQPLAPPPIKSATARPPPLGHLLLVDDNNLNLRVLSMCVKQIGCTYEQAEDGEQAVSAYRHTLEPYDLIFMDLSMPRMDGCTATREIRAYESACGLPRTTIIALTALGAEEARQEAFASGVDVFITKPVKMSEVRSLIPRYVRERSGRL
ncbi:hypothetical protein LTR62_007138 [Meristemomyces frigidus]|uniref:histidine kinase n=1 Tax=Meristemomyces frigidus TaxID=1508187 RepID=A0AAN7TC27_9PEZI|nr:hypothetical protein LTR62_007138 [Meristemomyces frigidus]